jgi:hypothetical protein
MTNNALLPSNPFCKTIAKRIYFSTLQKKNKIEKNPKNDYSDGQYRAKCDNFGDKR